MKGVHHQNNYETITKIKKIIWKKIFCDFFLLKNIFEGNLAEFFFISKFLTEKKISNIEKDKNEFMNDRSRIQAQRTLHLSEFFWKNILVQRIYLFCQKTDSQNNWNFPFFFTRPSLDSQGKKVFLYCFT